MSGRVHKSILNAEVNLIFYFLSLLLAFFSRKVFLDCLGTEFIGLTGTLGNILGYLNLAELGITWSIGFFLFKPLQTNNKQEIQEILSLLGYLYNWIGLFILSSGIIISLFFPLIFSGTRLGLGIIYFAFYSFLWSSLIGYFINYRQTLLAADQKNYIVAIYLQTAQIIKTILQLYLAYSFNNLFFWVGIEFLFSIIGCIMLNWKINKEYPWLNVNKKAGKYLLRKYPEVITKTRQVIIHKIKDFLLIKSDELFVFIFVSLNMVAFYGNYMMIVSRLSSLFSAVTGNVGASIGNLVAEGNKRKMMEIFWEYTTILHTIAAILCFSLYILLEPFIVHWLGANYIMDHHILQLLIVFLYIANSRNSVDSFNHAHGLYADTWSAWAELFLNVGVTIICGLKWGIAGILLGKISSLIPIVVFWKPHYLFSAGFHIPTIIYWQGVLRNYAISICSALLAYQIISYIPLNPYSNLWQWILYAFVSMSIFLVILLSSTMLFAKGSKGILSRIIKISKL